MSSTKKLIVYEIFYVKHSAGITCKISRKLLFIQKFNFNTSLRNAE